MLGHKIEQVGSVRNGHQIIIVILQSVFLMELEGLKLKFSPNMCTSTCIIETFYFRGETRDDENGFILNIQK